MNAIQILATQPWVERLGLTLLHFLWQGTIVVTIYAAVRKWGARTLGAERPISSRLCRPNGDGARSNRDLDAAARAVAGIRCRHLQRTHVRRANSSPFEPSPLRFRVRCIAAAARTISVLGGRVLDDRRDRILAAAARWLDTRRTSSLQNGARRICSNGSGRSIGSKLASLSLDRCVCSYRDLYRRRQPLDGFGRLCWCRRALWPGCRAAQMEALLLHELAHIRRHDYLVHILQSVVEAVFFYHPGVWWISGHMRAERELCCDDIAVSITGDAVVYARALAEFDSARFIQPAVMAANGGSVAERIARLLGQSSTAGHASSGPATVASADPVGDWGVGRICSNRDSAAV